jgi:hypothetical protein
MTTVSLGQQIWSFGDLLLKARMMKALEEGSSHFPIYRWLRFAAREDVVDLFDRLALNPAWSAQRLSAWSMVLDGEGLLVTADAGRSAGYCSCTFGIWADSVERAESAKARIEAEVATTRVNEPMFSIDWHFLSGKRELESASIEELADDVLHDSAYPEIRGGVAAFIRDYLASAEAVLVVQGPPGTGKTRLIRAILGAIARARGSCRALYTGDAKTMENDEIFVKFITGWEDAFVVEDADHLLKPRAQGNENLHRFLTIADGVVRAQGRKIVFSTNLPNVGDLDDALIRPGRCFARLHCRELTPAEALRVVDDVCGADRGHAAHARARIATSGARSISLASVYKFCIETQATATAEPDATP